MDAYELGAMTEEEILGAANEEVLSKKIKEMVAINEDLYKALNSYVAAVTAGRWLGGAVGLLVYSADDVAHAKWEVENWHTGALKWMTDGANGVRNGTVKEQAWGDWGITLAKNAEVMANKLRDSGLVSRSKAFAASMPAAFKTTLSAASGAAGSAAKSLIGGLPWWLIAAGSVVGIVVVAGAVTDVVKTFKGHTPPAE